MDGDIFPALNPTLLALAGHVVNDEPLEKTADLAAGGAASLGGMGGAGTPPDPASASDGASPGGGLDPALQAMIQQAVQQAAGAGQGSGAALKPKIDVNVELMQIKNMLAKICDHIGVQIPAQDMAATSDKLLAMAQGQTTAAPADPNGGAGQSPGGSAISPIEPIQAAMPQAPGGHHHHHDLKTASVVGREFDADAFLKTAGERAAGAGLAARARALALQAQRVRVPA